MWAGPVYVLVECRSRMGGPAASSAASTYDARSRSACGGAEIGTRTHSILIWIAVLAAGAFVLLVLGLIYLSVVLAWTDHKTRGLGYYGLPPAQRARFKRTLRRHAVLLSPLLRVLAAISKFRFASASFRFEGVSGPKGTCTEESFATARTYRPRPEDVFVVTQMKCGTTWMQHLVYQVVMRGKGDLVETGTALHAVSPWLEGIRTIEVDAAPTVGTERPSRIIKTHFPAHLCPRDLRARYVYVTRHPGSCFASCVDFNASNLGVFTPELSAMEEWFCSDDLMWWGTWPAHVAGWKARADEDGNVLWIEFEEMKDDLSRVAVRVAEFLGLEPLDDSELSLVVEKCSFDYMRKHQTAFEMHPPHLLSVNAELFVRGSADRYRDIPSEVNERIVRWCREAASLGDSTTDPLPAANPERRRSSA